MKKFILIIFLVFILSINFKNEVSADECIDDVSIEKTSYNKKGEEMYG